MIEYNKEGIPPELFTAFAHSSAAIVHGDYHKALVTLQQALKKVLDAKDSVMAKLLR